MLKQTPWKAACVSSINIWEIWHFDIIKKILFSDWKVSLLRLQFNIFQVRADIQNSCLSSADYFHNLLVIHFIYKMSQNVQDKCH